MILYNMRERGAFEYDKFALNTLQLHNAIILEEMNELKEHSENAASLLVTLQNIETIFKSTIGTANDDGLSDIIYKATSKKWRET